MVSMRGGWHVGREWEWINEEEAGDKGDQLLVIKRVRLDWIIIN